MARTNKDKKDRRGKSSPAAAPPVVAKPPKKRRDRSGRKARKPTWSARSRVEQLMAGLKPERTRRAHHLHARALMSHEEAADWAVRAARSLNRPIELFFRSVRVPVVGRMHASMVSARLRAICPEHDIFDATEVVQQ